MVRYNQIISHRDSFVDYGFRDIETNNRTRNRLKPTAHLQSRIIIGFLPIQWSDRFYRFYDIVNYYHESLILRVHFYTQFF